MSSGASILFESVAASSGFCLLAVHPLGAAQQLPSQKDPGNRGWTPVVSQQAGFPCQMLSEGFWAATHLSLHCQSSSTSEQHWVTSAVVHVTCVLS